MLNLVLTSCLQEPIFSKTDEEYCGDGGQAVVEPEITDAMLLVTMVIPVKLVFTFSVVLVTIETADVDTSLPKGVTNVGVLDNEVRHGLFCREDLKISFVVCNPDEDKTTVVVISSTMEEAVGIIVPLLESVGTTQLLIELADAVGTLSKLVLGTIGLVSNLVEYIGFVWILVETVGPVSDVVETI